MKCPNCNQEIIDNKDYCPNCGKKLRESKTGISVKKLFIIIAVLIVIGVSLPLSIMYLGTEKELDKYTNNHIDNDVKNDVEDNKDNTNNEDLKLDTFYGNYIINNITTTSDTPEEISSSKKELIGWEVEFRKDLFKFGLYKIDWILVNNPDVYLISDKAKYKKLLNVSNDSDITILSLGGDNTITMGSTIKDKVNIIKNNNSIYIYYANTLFELKKSTFTFKNNKNFYKLNFLDAKYTEEINNKITAINNNVKKAIESDIVSIIVYDYRIIEDGNINHILIDVSFGYPNSSISTTVYNISYNKNTLKMYNLKDYLSYIEKSYDSIVNEFNTKKQDVLKDYEGDILESINISENSSYYVENGKLYILCAKGTWGNIYLEIKL